LAARIIRPGSKDALLKLVGRATKLSGPGMHLPQVRSISALRPWLGPEVESGILQEPIGDELVEDECHGFRV
jgi:hypothetical protein